MAFQSILFLHAADLMAGEVPEPACFRDLNLDQLVRAATAGREAYHLEGWYRRLLGDVDAVAFRHEVLAALGDAALRDPVNRFCGELRGVRQQLEAAAKHREARQAQRGRLAAALRYCATLEALDSALRPLQLPARGLQSFRDHLAGLLRSAPFQRLAGTARATKAALDGVHYDMHVFGSAIIVRSHEGGSDYGAEVAATFDRFRHRPAKDYRVDLPAFEDLNHVEAEVLDRVARLDPEPFRLLADFAVANPAFLDEGVARFDDEDVTFLRSLALLAAPAIASSRLLEEAERTRLLLEEENRALRLGAGEEAGLVGQAPAFRRVVELARRVASADVTVLVRGESGTGKERLARLVHALSPRHAGPFVPLNCAAVPETLLEAELFGIERGVATGVSARLGKFELAGGGTLFLDEIGDLTPALQAKLLRVVQEREVERVGGRQRITVDVRLVTATNRDLEAMLADGEFREDLYYRLRVVELTLPPLRERREDIPLLARHFVRLHGRRMGREGLSLARPALELLLRHDFPGNVRELENLLEAAAALASGDRVEAADLRLAMGVGRAGAAATSGTLDEAVRAHVLRAVERSAGNRVAAARALGIDRTTLYRMLLRWNATADAKRNEAAKSAPVPRSRRRTRP